MPSIQEANPRKPGLPPAYPVEGPSASPHAFDGKHQSFQVTLEPPFCSLSGNNHAKQEVAKLLEEILPRKAQVSRIDGECVNLSEELEIRSLRETVNHERQNVLDAMESLSTTCAEYNWFNPTFRTSTAQSNDDHDNGSWQGRRKATVKFLSPSPEAVKIMLAYLFINVWRKTSSEVDKAYEQTAVQAREAANNEYSGFNWEAFQGMIQQLFDEMEE